MASGGRSARRLHADGLTTVEPLAPRKALREDGGDLAPLGFGAEPDGLDGLDPERLDDGLQEAPAVMRG